MDVIHTNFEVDSDILFFGEWDYYYNAGIIYLVPVEEYCHNGKRTKIIFRKDFDAIKNNSELLALWDQHKKPEAEQVK